MKANLGRIEPRGSRSCVSNLPVVPALRRDPYAAALSMKMLASDTLRNNYRRGVWVPAQGRDDSWGHLTRVPPFAYASCKERACGMPLARSTCR